MTDRAATVARVPDPASRSESRIDRLYHERPQPAAFARGYLAYLAELMDRLDEQAIAALADAMLDARQRGSTIFFIGNGGSAATASHFANDIGIGTRSSGKPFRAMSLTDNAAVMTAIANDDGYEEVFVRQLKVHLRPGDLVVAISASGNSPNVVKAVEWANANGAMTAGLTGFDGGRLRALAQIGVHVASGKGEYGPTEDIHMILDHLIGAYLIGRCRAEERR